jgi:hypothetical protein
VISHTLDLMLDKVADRWSSALMTPPECGCTQLSRSCVCCYYIVTGETVWCTGADDPQYPECIASNFCFFGSENGIEYSFETSCSFPTTQHYKPEGRSVHSHRCDNLRSSLCFVSLTALCGKSDLIMLTHTIAHSTEVIAIMVQHTLLTSVIHTACAVN